MATRGQDSTARRSLAPREHGAYGQLGVPLLTALAQGRPGIEAAALAIAAAALFVAHEPLLVLLGRRGRRARREDGGRAARALAITGALATGLGALGLALAPAARAPALLSLGLAALVGLLASRGEERTTAGEIAAAAALSSAGLPVAAAAGVPAPLAWWSWAVWCVSFGSATLAVRAALAHRKRPVAAWRRLIPTAFAAAFPPALFVAGVAPGLVTLGAAPMTLTALALSAVPPAPAQLRRVGWSLVAGSVITGALLIAAGHV